MSLWNTPPEWLAGDNPVAKAAARFMRDTEALDRATADTGSGGKTAVLRRMDVYASADELARAVRDLTREEALDIDWEIGWPAEIPSEPAAADRPVPFWRQVLAAIARQP